MMAAPVKVCVIGCLVLLRGLASATAQEAPMPMPPTITPAAPLAATPAVPVMTGAPAARATAAAKPAMPLNDTQQYCQNIAAAAADARFAWQRKQLTDLQGQLKERIADLEAREAEFKLMIAKRDDLVKKATDTVVGIYSHMKADAAATQLAALDDDVAASILVQLTQKQASIILTEIPADRAAKLVGAMTMAAPMPEKKS